MWSAVNSSRLGYSINYSTTKTFATFPFPVNWVTLSALEDVGRKYYAFRDGIMCREDYGLTDVYGRFHDPEDQGNEIVELRALHAAMDRAVLDAYAWRDIPTDYKFALDEEIEADNSDDKRKPWRYRWPDEVRDEVLARLLELNAARAGEERRSGAAASGGRQVKRALHEAADPSDIEDLFS